MNEPQPAAPRTYRWPRIALGFVLLFFTMCVLFMVKEVRRLKRDRAADIDMRRSSLSNSPPVSPPSR